MSVYKICHKTFKYVDDNLYVYKNVFTKETSLFSRALGADRKNLSHGAYGITRLAENAEA